MKYLRAFVYPALILLFNSFSIPTLSSTDDWVQIRNQMSRLCLDVPDGSSENRLKIQQYECREAGDSWIRAQLWQFKKVGKYVQIRNQLSGLCLDVPYGNSENLQKIQQYECRKPDDSWIRVQLWQLKKVGRYVQIRNQISELCLDVPVGSSENRLKIQQYECRQVGDSWIKAQLWQLK